MMRALSFVILITILSARASTTVGANTNTTSKCEQQLTPATMVDLRALYHKSVSESLTPEQRTMVASLYKEKLKTAADTYSTTMKQLHAWVIAQEAQDPQGAQATPTIPMPPRRIFQPHTTHVLSGHTRKVTSATFSADDTKVLTSSEDCTTQIWNASTGKLLHTLNGSAAKFSNDGTKVLTTSNSDTALIYNVETGEVIHSLTGDKGYGFYHAAFSPDDTRVVLASTDNTAHIWNATTGTLIVKLKGHIDIVYFAVFSPDGKQVVTASGDRTARVWDAKTGKEVFKLTGHKHELSSAVFSADSKQAVTTSSDHTTRIWNVTTGQSLFKRIFNIGSRIRTHTHVLQLKDDETFFKSSTFSPDGTKVLTITDGDKARLWSTTTGKEIRTLSGHFNWISKASFSVDGTRVITASQDKSARIWDITTGEELASLVGHVKAVSNAAFSSDSTKVVTTSEDMTARIWDLYVNEEDILSATDTKEDSL